MEKLQLPGMTLEGFAQGGIRTSIAAHEVGALFDVGTPLPNCLRYDKIFVTHGHPDHVGAISTVVARRNLQDLHPVDVYVPAVIKPDLEQIFECWWRINGGHGPKFPVNIHGCKVGDEIIGLKPGMKAIGLKTYHRIDSIGWCIQRTTKKLKKEFVDKSGKEIGELKRSGVVITDDTTINLLTIPGDTTIDFLINEEKAYNAKILVHEVTVWDERSSVQKTRRYGHTHYREMIENCEKFNGDYLVLCHRSMKYSRKFVEDVVKKEFPASMKDKICIFDGGDNKSKK